MLSGGEQQRVALARAMAPRPRIMLMDEPFSGLDNRLRDGIRDETLEILKEDGTAVVLVTHEPEEAMRMADQIALMRGRQDRAGGRALQCLQRALRPGCSGVFFSDINVVTGTVRGALTTTPFGEFLAPRLSRRQRGRHRLSPPARQDRLRPERARGRTPRRSTGCRHAAWCGARASWGTKSLVEFLMDFDDSILRATVPGVFLPKPGKPLWLTVRRDRCFVFPHRD